MNDLSHRARYEARLNRVLDHIYDHLDEPLDIDRLAEIACLSPYHWHRIYQAMHGETVASTVRRLRLHRAAGYLATDCRDCRALRVQQSAVVFKDVSGGVRYATSAVSQARHT